MIDPAKLYRFDVKAVPMSYFPTQVLETVQFCKFALMTEVFPRGDYRELLELTLMYLSPEASFRICAPSRKSHARLMAKATYNLKVQLLHPQLTYQITAGQQKEVKRMAEFVSIF